MTIENIDIDKCISCGTCVASCPCDVIRMDSESNKAKITYQKDCQNCHICRYFCPAKAITSSSSTCTSPMVGWG